MKRLRAFLGVFLTLALMVWLQGFPRGLWLWAAAMGCVGAHEGGHVLAARWRGVPVGGVFYHLVPYARVAPQSPTDRALLALAGPAASLALGALLALGLGVRPPPDATSLTAWLRDPGTFALGTTVAMGVFNLVPSLPLDGGHVLVAALEREHGLAAGLERARRISLVIACILMAVGYGFMAGADLGFLLGTLGLVCLFALVRRT